ncbi:MAG: glycosyltransferase 87 family protein [Gaiella sp.]
MSPARGPALAGAALALVASVGAACLSAWPRGSAVAPGDGRHLTVGTAWGFVLLLTLATAAYAIALVLLRGSGASRLAAVAAVAVVVQVVPLGAPLLLSTDAWTYWGYGRIAVEGGNPYLDPPAETELGSASRYVGAEWRETTSVYGPAFTLASEPIARAAGSSASAAAWLHKSLASGAIVAAAVLAARLARRRALALAAVGWNPVLAVHMGGGGHNDAWVGALLAAALLLAATGRDRWSGGFWTLAILVKWIPAVFLVLHWLAPARTRRPRLAGLVVAGLVILGLATWRYGLAWTRALVPLAENAAHETSYALSSRLEEVGVPRGLALALALAGFVAGATWLVRESRASRPRLGRAACLVLCTTPYLAVWYLGWAVPLAAADDDDVALLGVLALSAYLLPQTIPL